MKPLRVFYAVFVPPGRERTLLDTMRLFAQPDTKHPAHVTVRGPYHDYCDPRAWSRAVNGQRVEVDGVGIFLGTGQNTVFLRVTSSAIRSVWHKPDYPDYNPHLTIYDGSSRRFAEALRDTLADCEPRFGFAATGLEPIVSGNGSCPPRYVYDPSEIEREFGPAPTLAEIDAADDCTRLGWVAALAERLSADKCAV